MVAVYGGYELAQAHYAKLKHTFIEKVNQQANKLERGAHKQFFNEIETSLSQYANSAEVESPFMVLNNIFNDFAEKITSNQNNSNWINEASNKLKQAQYEEKELSDKEKDQLNKELKAVTSSVRGELQKTLLKSIRNNITGSSKNATERYSAVLDQINTFLFTYIKTIYKTKGAATNFSFFGWPMKRLGGFIAEDLSYQGLIKIFKDTGVNVTPGGTKKFGGKMIEMDNILSFMNSTRGLNKQLKVTANTKNFLKDYDENLANIDYFGEQVKTWDVENLQQDQRIAGRQELLQAFRLACPNSQASLSHNRRFMSLYSSILTTFRPDTLFFTGKGQKRMFINDFIRNFRSKNYLLQLQPNEKGQPTSTVWLVKE